MEVRAGTTIKEGLLNAQVLAFDGSDSLGFILWRWTADDSGHGSTATFRHANVPHLLALLERVGDALTSRTTVDPSAKTRTLNQRVLNAESCLHSMRNEDVFLTIHAGKRTPWFQLRRFTTNELTITANWFFETHIPKLRAAILEADRWFIEHAAPVAA